MQNHTRLLALGGILGALTLIDLWLAAIVPNLKLMLYGLSALPMAVIVIEGNRRLALIFYGATALLALLLLPGTPLSALPYVLVLGLYGLVKSLAEAGHNRIVEWVWKLLYFNATMAVYYLLIVTLLIPDIVWPVALWLLVLLAEAAFVAGDVIYSIAINFYEKRLRPYVFNRRS